MKYDGEDVATPSNSKTDHTRKKTAAERIGIKR
jgi:hypothetical protein